MQFGILTIKPAVPLGESGQKELAALLHGLQEVSLALQGQCLFHLTGAAGVVLRTETQVLTYKVMGRHAFGSVSTEKLVRKSLNSLIRFR